MLAERFFGIAVGDKLDPEEEANTADIADVWVITKGRFQPISQVLAHLSSPPWKILLKHDVQVGERSGELPPGGRRRSARAGSHQVRAAATDDGRPSGAARGKRVGHFLADQDRTEWRVGRGNALGGSDQVRHDIVVLGRKQLPSRPKPQITSSMIIRMPVSSQSLRIFLK